MWISHDMYLPDTCFSFFNPILSYMKIAQITDNLEKLVESFNKNTFILKLRRSIKIILHTNGNAITEKNETSIKQFEENFSGITDEDKKSGYIYILKSKREKSEIKTIKHLYKIGFSTTTVEKRIKNATLEPTYLMANMRITTTYKCFNMNAQKLELMLQDFFGSSYLNVDAFDNPGNRHTPREWFIAPLDIIEQAIQLIISGEIVKFRYNEEKKDILIRKRLLK